VLALESAPKELSAGFDKQAQITFFARLMRLLFCQPVTFLADYIHGIKLVIKSLTQKSNQRL